MLRVPPKFLPDPGWSEPMKERLVNAYDGWYTRLNTLRHWALYVSTESDLTRVADAVVARGTNWRPLAVQPGRVVETIRALEPALVIVDSHMPECSRVVEEVRLCSPVRVVMDEDMLGRPS